jgi:hypothetical protein
MYYAPHNKVLGKEHIEDASGRRAEQSRVTQQGKHCVTQCERTLVKQFLVVLPSEQWPKSSL